MSTKYVLIYLLLAGCFSVHGQRLIERSGKASFHSEAPVENISATNEQVLAVLDISTGEVAVTMLMKGFTFRKALMQEHFNESYVESDKFPKATFAGKILNYSPALLENESNVRVEGELTIHGVTRTMTANVVLLPKEENILVTTEFPVRVAEYDIEIPSVVMNNIAEVVAVKVNLVLKKT